MTYLVILTTYAASRATEIQQIRDQDGFVAVGSTSSRPEHHSAAQQIAALGWAGMSIRRRPASVSSSASGSRKRWTSPRTSLLG